MLQSFSLNSIIYIDKFALMSKVVVSIDFKFILHLKQSVIYRWIFSIGKNKGIW